MSLTYLHPPLTNRGYLGASECYLEATMAILGQQRLFGYQLGVPSGQYKVGLALAEC